MVQGKLYFYFAGRVNFFMMFAPWGDGGCPHQPVSVIMCTTVFLFLLLTSIWWWCNPWTDTNKTGADVMDRP